MYYEMEHVKKNLPSESNRLRFDSKQNDRMRRGIFWLFLGLLFLVALWFLIELNQPPKWVSTHPVAHQLWGQGITRTELNDAEFLCSGHFDPDWHRPNWLINSVSMTINGYTYTGVDKKLYAFHVDHYWKGSGAAVIDVALFSDPPFFVNVFAPYGDINTGRLLLALKKDTTGSPACQLTGIIDSWLPLPDQALANETDAAPDKIVEDSVVSMVNAFADSPPPVAQGRDEPDYQKLDVLDQPLSTAASFGLSDDRAVQALDKIIENPTLHSRHDEAFAALVHVDLAHALGWKHACDLYLTGTLSQNDRYSLARELSSVINADSLARIDPAQLLALIQKDPLAQHQMAYAFWQIRDPRVIPWLGGLLSSNDRGTQFMSIDRLICYFGAGKRDPAQGRSYDPPYPEEVLAPYKTWVALWVQQHPEYALPVDHPAN